MLGFNLFEPGDIVGIINIPFRYKIAEFITSGRWCPRIGVVMGWSDYYDAYLVKARGEIWYFEEEKLCLR